MRRAMARAHASPSALSRKVDELLRVVEPLAQRAPRPPLGPRVARPRWRRHDGRDDERPEARPEPVLVDPDADLVVQDPAPYPPVADRD